MYSFTILYFLPLKKSLPFLPITMRDILHSFFSSMSLKVFLIILPLKPPHSPLSEVITTISTFFSSRRERSGWAVVSTRHARLLITSSIFRAYGRAATIASCAFLILVADMSFIALVICWVFLTLFILRFISLKVAIKNQVKSFKLQVMSFGGRSPKLVLSVA